MTSSEIPQRLAFPQPFASGSGAALSVFGDSTSETVNYADGFPSNYSAPHSTGGKYVLRGDINAIGNLATNDLFYHKCGGINTFDANFAAKVGGYPRGAVLQMLVGNSLYDVVSLVDNNKVDFTGAPPTSAQTTAGINAGSVDGINWAYCNTSEVVLPQPVEWFNIVSPPAELEGSWSGYFTPDKDVTGANCVARSLGCFLAPRSGAVTFLSDFGYSSTGTIPANTAYGFGVVFCDLGTSTSGYSSLVFPNMTSDFSTGDWKIAYQINLGYKGSSAVTRLSNVTPLYITSGHYYVFAMFNAVYGSAPTSPYYDAWGSYFKATISA